eukprot:403331928
MRDRMTITQYDEEIQKLEREKQKIQMASEDREINLRKFDDLIKQSDAAIQKLVMSTQKLNEALNQALEENL